MTRPERKLAMSGRASPVEQTPGPPGRGPSNPVENTGSEGRRCGSPDVRVVDSRA